MYSFLPTCSSAPPARVDFQDLSDELFELGGAGGGGEGEFEGFVAGDDLGEVLNREGESQEGHFVQQHSYFPEVDEFCVLRVDDDWV